MENQHKHIKGYRDLSQAEIDLMNRIKAHAELTRQLVEHIQALVDPQSLVIDPGLSGAELNQLMELATSGGALMHGDALLCAGGHRAGPSRWVDLADDHLQQGFMALTRAVAQPTTY